ncbi:MAG: stage II sporulation protein R [Clostridia bacterium]|nr:stage II sporulation protein R [Clostridia bacterium]
MKNGFKLSPRLLIPALIAGLILAAAFEAAAFSNDVSEVSRAVMRLHVIADGDGAWDQFVKLRVRDTVLRATEDIAADAGSKDEFVSLIAAHLSEIERAANDTMSSLGYPGTARAFVEHAGFPTREYNGVTLPAGRYDALKVVIGEGRGRNFWCVMFPPLCGGAIETRQGEEYLKDNLSPGAFLMITDPESDVRYEIRIWAADVISGLINK